MKWMLLEIIEKETNIASTPKLLSMKLEFCKYRTENNSKKKLT